MAFSHAYNQGNTQDHPTFKLLPMGEYPVQVVKSQDKISRSTGKDMIELELEVTDGEYKGSKLWQYITDDQYADQKIRDIMESCGKVPPAQVTSATFRGLSGRVKTKQREYNGETKAEIAYWVRRASGTAAPAAPATSNPTEPNDIPF